MVVVAPGALGVPVVSISDQADSVSNVPSARPSKGKVFFDFIWVTLVGSRVPE